MLEFFFENLADCRSFARNWIFIILIFMKFIWKLPVVFCSVKKFFEFCFWFLFDFLWILKKKFFFLLCSRFGWWTRFVPVWIRFPALCDSSKSLNNCKRNDPNPKPKRNRHDVRPQRRIHRRLRTSVAPAPAPMILRKNRRLLFKSPKVLQSF